MLGGDRHCSSRGKIFLNSHVISQDHVTQEPCDFISRNLKVIHHLAIFCDHRHRASGDNMISVCQTVYISDFARPCDQRVTPPYD